MPRSTSRHAGPAALAARLGLASAAVLLATLAALELAGREADTAALAARIAEVELSAAHREVLRRRLAASGEPAAARIRIATALLEEAEQEANLGTGAAPEALAARLALAADLAREAWAARPAAWQAPTLLGAATYLQRLLTRDRAVATDWRDWDDPLSFAHRLAPAAPGPPRFLVTAYLDLWHALTPDRRELARDLLQRAMEEPDTFAHLIDPWLAIADDPEAAIEALPDRPHVWSGLARRFASSGDWTSLIEVRQRWRGAVATELDARLAEARRRRDGGDLVEARRLYLGTIARAPTERGFVPYVEKALSEAPPGPGLPSLHKELRGWLDWSLRLSLYDRAPLPPPLVDRLAGLAGDLPPETAAHAALVAGDLSRGEHQERRFPDSRWRQEWGPYWIAKARTLTERGQTAEATAALSRVDPAWRDLLPYLLAERELAAAHGVGSLVRTGGARRPPAREDASGEWRIGRRHATAELHTTFPIAEIVFEVDESQETGAIELVLDGEVLGARRVRGGRTLRFPASAPAGAHLVEATLIGGRRFVPRPVSAGGSAPRGGAAHGG